MNVFNFDDGRLLLKASGLFDFFFENFLRLLAYFEISIDNVIIFKWRKFNFLNYEFEFYTIKRAGKGGEIS